MTIHVVSGYFIHGLTEGHKQMLKSVRSRMTDDDILYIIINNERQQRLKYKSAERNVQDILINIMNSTPRELLLNTRIHISIDSDRTVCKTLKKLVCKYKNDTVIFYNDGDVTEHCPEEHIHGILCVYLGNPKISSSGEEKR